VDFGDLQDPEFQARLKGAKTPEELLENAKEGGFELDDVQLEAVSGGCLCSDYRTDFHCCKSDGPL
jgi:hypothetical protein